jgi:hypothetical protein
MSNRLLRTWLPLALAAAAAASLHAQGTGVSFDTKIRGGFTMGSLFDDLRAQKMMGVAMGMSMPMAGGRLLADFGFEYFPGKDYDAMPKTGTFYYNPASPATSYNGTPIALAISAGSYGSADRRKMRMQGFNVRVGYSAKAFAGWDWQAGLSLDNFKVSEERTGTLYPLAGTTSITNPAVGKVYYESLSVVSERTKMGLGAFAGLSTQMTDDAKLEFNLRSVGYTSVQYQPFTYTGRPVSVDTKNRMGLALEVSLGLRM